MSIFNRRKVPLNTAPTSQQEPYSPPKYYDTDRVYMIKNGRPIEVEIKESYPYLNEYKVRERGAYLDPITIRESDLLPCIPETTGLHDFSVVLYKNTLGRIRNIRYRYASPEYREYLVSFNGDHGRWLLEKSITPLQDGMIPTTLDEMDQSTGLPTLPEGYTFYVSKSTEYTEVAPVYDLSLISPDGTSLASHHINKYEEDVRINYGVVLEEITPALIYHTAIPLVTTAKKHKARKEYRDRAETFLGSYPNSTALVDLMIEEETD